MGAPDTGPPRSSVIKPRSASPCAVLVTSDSITERERTRIGADHASSPSRATSHVAVKVSKAGLIEGAYQLQRVVALPL